jgi:hypothetical protein
LLPLAPELRVAAVALLTVPIGFLMGVPFARGVAALADAPAFVPWAWAANGGASVVSGVLAAVLALWIGFTAVLLVAAGLYLVAAAVVPGAATSRPRA